MTSEHRLPVQFLWSRLRGWRGVLALLILLSTFGYIALWLVGQVPARDVLLPFMPAYLWSTATLFMLYRHDKRRPLPRWVRLGYWTGAWIVTTMQLVLEVVVILRFRI